MAEPTTYTLKTPIIFGTETIAKLTLRKPKAGDLREMPVQGATIGHTMNVVSKISGQPNAVIDEMDPEDLMEVTKLFNLF